MKLTSSIGVCKSKDEANEVAMRLIAEGREDVVIMLPHLDPWRINTHIQYMSFWVNYTSGEDPSLDNLPPDSNSY